MSREVPQGWRVVSISDVALSIDSGWSPDCETAPAKPGEWGVLKTSAVVWDGFRFEENKRLPGNLSPRPDIEVRPGDVLVTRAGPVERTGVVTYVRQTQQCLMLSDKLVRIRSKPELCDPEYLSLVLSAPLAQTELMRKKSGMAMSQTNVSQKTLRELTVQIPPLHEQRRIAEILSSVDETIAATRAVIEQIRKVKQGVLERLLTKGIGHTRFKQTEIGEIPDGWSVAMLGNLSEFVTSGSRGWAAYYADNGAIFLRIANLTRSSIRMRLNEIQRVQLPQGSSEGARTRVEIGDILISITADLGIVGHISQEFETEAYVNQHIALVRPIAGLISSAFLAYALSGPASQRQFQHLNDSGAKAGLNLPTIRRFAVPLPPMDEQLAIAKSLSSIDDALESEERQLRTQIAVKSALMSDLLSGRKRVTDALLMAAE